MHLSAAIQTPEISDQVSVSLRRGGFPEAIQSVADAGLSAVELLVVHPGALDAKAIRRQIQDLGLAVCAVGTGAAAALRGLSLVQGGDAKQSEAEGYFFKTIEFANRLGAPLVTVGSFRGRIGQDRKTGRSMLTSILRRAASIAQDQGVRLVLEPLNRYETDFLFNAQQALDFLEEISHPAIGLLLDTFHMNIEERSWSEPISAGVESGKLWHVHVGDNNRLAPGFGMIDFGSILSSLEEYHYQGFISAEFLPEPNPRVAMDKMVGTLCG